MNTAPMRIIRKQRGMTLAYVASVIDMSISFLSDVERGRTRPSFKTLERLAQIYGVPAKSLVSFGDEDKQSLVATIHVKPGTSPETLRALAEMLKCLSEDFDRLAKGRGK